MINRDELSNICKTPHCLKYQVYLSQHTFTAFHCVLNNSFYQKCILANSADTDEMPHYAAFHLGLYCLSKYSCRWLRLLSVLRRWLDSVVVDLLFYVAPIVCWCPVLVFVWYALLYVHSKELSC